MIAPPQEKRKFTRKQVQMRLFHIRRHYSLGLLTPQQIAQYETLPNWSWTGQKHGWTKEELIAEVQRVAKTLGKTPTFTGFNKEAKCSTSTVINRLGSWNRALQAAGLTHNNFIGYTADDCITELKRVAKHLNHTPTRNEFDKYAALSSIVPTRFFKTWNSALRAAGLPVNLNWGLTKKDYILEIQRVAKALGKAPTIREFDEQSTYSTDRVIQRFGTWSKGLKAAGFAPNVQRYTQKQVRSELKRVAKKLGKTPTQEEFNKHATMRVGTVENLIGSWNEAILAAGLKVATFIGWTKKDCLDELKRVAKELNHTPSHDEFLRHARMSMSPVVKFFGSWVAILTAAKLSTSKNFTKRDCIAEIIRITCVLGRTPTSRDFLKHARTGMGMTTIKRLCGSWNNALTVSEATQ